MAKLGTNVTFGIDAMPRYRNAVESFSPGLMRSTYPGTKTAPKHVYANGIVSMAASKSCPGFRQNPGWG